MGLTEQERKKALEYAYNGADFMFSAPPELRQMIINDNPRTEKIEKNLKLFLLDGKAVALETDMVIRYCNHQLDENNTWLFDHGNIHIIPYKITIK